MCVCSVHRERERACQEESKIGTNWLLTETHLSQVLVTYQRVSHFFPQMAAQLALDHRGSTWQYDKGDKEDAPI